MIANGPDDGLELFCIDLTLQIRNRGAEIIKNTSRTTELTKLNFQCRLSIFKCSGGCAALICKQPVEDQGHTGLQGPGTAYIDRHESRCSTSFVEQLEQRP